ncbi:hypothetical protein [Nonlabens xylanidelens]|nr:hypothetical protein [Nonlabens xylanidelens]PQJ21419.1 hypothetical protein BST94_04295 [Nonlabens xylanidelens]
MKSIKHYDIGYADIFIFKLYLIVQVKEGYSVEVDDIDIFHALIENHFSDQKFIYISNRVYSYSVNPLIYPKVAAVENLIGMAVVADNGIKIKTASFEKNFLSKPFIICSTLDEAIIWASQQF